MVCSLCDSVVFLKGARVAASRIINSGMLFCLPGLLQKSMYDKFDFFYPTSRSSITESVLVESFPLHNFEICNQFLFCAIFFRIWEQNLSLKWAISDVFLPAVCQLHSRQTPTSAILFTLLNAKLFFHQIVANLPENATGIVRILRTFKIWGFFGKIDGFFEKKTCFFFKIDKGGKFAIECASNSIIS